MAKVNEPIRPRCPGEQSSLNTNALGLWGLVIMGIAYMGLALTAYFNFGIMEGITGPIVPLAFAAVTVAMLPTAASYAIMNSRRPSTGATLTWLWEATTPPLGVWLGWVLVIAYIDGLHPAAGHVRAVLQLVPQLLRGPHRLPDRHPGGPHPDPGRRVHDEEGHPRSRPASSGCSSRSRPASSRCSCLYILIKQGINGNLTWQPFNPTAATAGWTGFLNALLFAVLAIAAFDIVAPMAEETQDPALAGAEGDDLRDDRGRAVLGVHLVRDRQRGPGQAPWPATSRPGEFTPIYLVAGHYVELAARSWCR